MLRRRSSDGRRGTFGGRAGVWWKNRKGRRGDGHRRQPRLSDGSVASKDTVDTARLSLDSSSTTTTTSPSLWNQQDNLLPGDDEDRVWMIPSPVRTAAAASSSSVVERHVSASEGNDDATDRYGVGQSPAEDAVLSVDHVPLLRAVSSSSPSDKQDTTSNTTGEPSSNEHKDWNRCNDDELFGGLDEDLGRATQQHHVADVLDWDNVGEDEDNSSTDESDEERENHRDPQPALRSPSTWIQSSKRHRKFGGTVRFRKPVEQVARARRERAPQEAAKGTSVNAAHHGERRRRVKRKADDMSTPRTQREIRRFRDRFARIDREVTLNVESVDDPPQRPRRRRQVQKKLNLRKVLNS